MRMPSFVKDNLEDPCEKCGGKDFIVETDSLAEREIVKCVKCKHVKGITGTNI